MQISLRIRMWYDKNRFYLTLQNHSTHTNSMIYTSHWKFIIRNLSKFVTSRIETSSVRTEENPESEHRWWIVFGEVNQIECLCCITKRDSIKKTFPFNAYIESITKTHLCIGQYNLFHSIANAPITKHSTINSWINEILHERNFENTIVKVFRKINLKE